MALTSSSIPTLPSSSNTGPLEVLSSFTPPLPRSPSPSAIGQPALGRVRTYHSASTDTSLLPKLQGNVAGSMLALISNQLSSVMCMYPHASADDTLQIMSATAAELAKKQLAICEWTDIVRTLVAAAQEHMAKAVPTGYYNHPRIKFASVEGIIGAGKSTFSGAVIGHLETALQRSLPAQSSAKVFMCHEPVEQWMKSGMLDLFYADQRAWACKFQMYTFFTRIGVFCKQYRAAEAFVAQSPLHYAVLLSERCWWSGDRLFESLAVKLGTITSAEHNLYEDCFASAVSAINDRRPDLIAWVNTPPVECGRRIAIRDRSGEAVTNDYSLALYKEHADRFSAGEFDGVPVLEIDGSLAFNKDDSVAQSMAQTFAGKLVTLF